jgi:hypothetical protein
MRWLLVLAAGCFHPDPPSGLACDDWCPPPEQCIRGVCALAPSPNKMFVSSTTAVASMLDLAKADELCTTTAHGAGLRGNYIAWLSTANESAKDRLARTSPRGWVRTDGKPFADTVEDIVAGNVFYPPRLDERQVDRSDITEVATGTTAAGVASAYTCNDFDGSMGGMISVGLLDADAPLWTELANVPISCSGNVHLYCFGISNEISLEKPAPEGKLAFLSAKDYRSVLSDLDAGCTNEARAHGLTQSFVALVAPTGQSAMSRTQGGPWSRLDGVIVTEDLAKFDAPLSVKLDGTHERASTWFGAPTPLSTGMDSENCTNWTATATTTPHLGDSVRSSRSAFSKGDVIFCSDLTALYRVYCFER